MLREYAITLHFTMDDYDHQQDGDRLADYLRRIVESYADEDHSVTVNTERGAILDNETPIPTDPAAIIAAIRQQAAQPCGCGARNSQQQL